MSINKKIFGFIFALILVFSPYKVNNIFHVSYFSAEAAISFVYDTSANITDTTASTIVKGLVPNTTYPFYVILSSNSKTFITTSITSDAYGVASALVTNLTPNTSYFFSVPVTIGGIAFTDSPSFTTKASSVGGSTLEIMVKTGSLTSTSVTIQALGTTPGASYNIFIWKEIDYTNKASGQWIDYKTISASPYEAIFSTELMPGQTYYATFTPAGVSPFDASALVVPFTMTTDTTGGNTLEILVKPGSATSTSVTIQALGATTGVTYDIYLWTVANYATLVLGNATGHQAVAVSPFEATFTGLSPSQTYIATLSLLGTPPSASSLATPPFTMNSSLEVIVKPGSLTATSVTIQALGTSTGTTYDIFLWSAVNYIAATVGGQVDHRSVTKIPYEVAFTGLLPGQTYYVTLSPVGTSPFAQTSYVVPFTMSATGGGGGGGGGSTPPKAAFGGLVPLCNVGPVKTIPKTATSPERFEYAIPCDFNYLLLLINNLINFLLIYMATPLFALIIIYVAWLYLSDGGSSENIKHAKTVLKNAIIGYVIALAAWLIVKTILTTLGFNGPMYLASILSIINYI